MYPGECGLSAPLRANTPERWSYIQLSPLYQYHHQHKNTFRGTRYLSHCCASCYVTSNNLRTSVSGHMGARRIIRRKSRSVVTSQYAQNPDVKRLTYEDCGILRTKCIEITTLTSQFTWCHRSRNHSTRTGCFPIGGLLILSYYLVWLPRYFGIHAQY